MSRSVLSIDFIFYVPGSEQQDIGIHLLKFKQFVDDIRELSLIDRHFALKGAAI